MAELVNQAAVVLYQALSLLHCGDGCWAVQGMHSVKQFPLVIGDSTEYESRYDEKRKYTASVVRKCFQNVSNKITHTFECYICVHNSEALPAQ